MKHILPLLAPDALLLAVTPVFFALFLGIILRVFSSKRRELYKRMGDIPFLDGTASDDSLQNES
ncbi:MAG: cbb3-type cytochrome c oxidase subunit 3 [Candidatus Dadabacteria bacterium]|nr:MAG: cbb3-type cytochrome c oxidase subunit 3 [Candidatus Dadabacteria bacterium]